MGRSEYDAICEKTRLIHPKTYSCEEWKKNEWNIFHRKDVEEKIYACWKIPGEHIE